MHTFANLGLFLALLVWQIAAYTFLGNVLWQRLARADPLRSRLPELAFLLGAAAWALPAYALLVLRIPAAWINPIVAGLGIALSVYRRPAADLRLRESFPEVERYCQFRGTRAGWFAMGLVLLLGMAVALFRSPWLLEWTYADGQTAFGTMIWDDLRTLGFPISLAAFGYPLRSPEAIGMTMSYPLGAFLFAAGQVALFPSLALHAVIADNVTGALYFGCVAVLAIGVLVAGAPGRVFALLSSFTAVGFNLWRLKPYPESPMLLRFFGYYKTNALYTTKAWTPFLAQIWVLNHSLAFSALVFAALLYVAALRANPRGLPRGLFALVLIPVAYASVTSMDMTFMSGVTLGTMMTWLTAACLRRRWREFWSTWLWQGWAALGVAVCLFGLVNAPALLRQVDSVNEPLFPLVTAPFYNVGMLLSTAGATLGLMCLGAMWMWLGEGRREWVTLWLIPVCTCLLFSLAFEYYTIWFWRCSAAMPLLLALCCGVQLDHIRPHLVFRPLYVGLWTVALTAGVTETYMDVRAGLGALRLQAEQASVVRWVYGNTQLAERVVRYDAKIDTLTPDLTFLRTGNRSGRSIYDRSHPLIGYRMYSRRMSDLLEGIRANDYVIYYRDRAEFAGMLDACGAPVPFENAAARIYRVEEKCRNGLRKREVLERREALAKVQDAAAAKAQVTPRDRDLQERLANDAANAMELRRRAEAFWSKSQYAAAVLFLEPVLQKAPSAEGYYSLAHSYHNNGQLAEAVSAFDRALDMGYSEFWVRYGRGSTLLRLGELARARQDLLRARDLDGTHAGVKTLLASLP